MVKLRGIKKEEKVGEEERFDECQVQGFQ